MDVRPEAEGFYGDGAEYILQGSMFRGGIALLRGRCRAETIDTRFMDRKGVVARQGP
jgi:hypothetical protein